MAYTTINDPSAHFNTILYSGNSGNPRSLTGVGFKPDFLWVKRRNASERHLLTTTQMGVESGAYKWLDSADTEDDFGGGYGVASFDTDGFTFKGVDATWNASNNTYVAWSWKANGGTTSSNTAGTITSTVEANTTAGFSIFTYTGTGAAGTVGHGLGGLPDLIIFKGRNTTSSWPVYNDPQGDGTLQFPVLNLHTGLVGSGSPFTWDTTKFTFSSGSSYSNTSGTNYIAYAFRSIQGYSKYGRYIANANANGPFVYTGFKPAWVLRKATGRNEPWMLMDNKRDPINPLGTILDTSSSAGDSTVFPDYRMDLLSNGFKLRSGNTSYGNHTGGNEYIYMAFAENPFVTSTGIPATAK
jgi:hypothetical protein